MYTGLYKEEITMNLSIVTMVTLPVSKAMFNLVTGDGLHVLRNYLHFDLNLPP